MEQLILIFHVVAALGIIGLILIQQGKGANMGASFGSGGSQTVLGSQGGGNLLTKGTSVLAVLFFATSFGLAIVAKEKSESMGDVDMPVPALVESTNITAPVADQVKESGDIPTADPVVSGLNNEMPASPEEIPVSE